MKSLGTAFFFGLLLVAGSAQAYIPPYWMIMSRVAENHGRGMYQVDQDVVFSHHEEPAVLHERWFILNENEMRVEVSSKRGFKTPVRFVYVYDNNRRYYMDEKGGLKNVREPEHWIEPYFHFRYSKNIKPLLVARKVVPSETLRSEPVKYTPPAPTKAGEEKTPTTPREPFMRLGRMGGVVAYAVGRPTPAGSSEGLPGLWIEQDMFNILKIRFPNQLEVNAGKYKTFSAGLSAPLEREVIWGDKNVKILMSNAQSISSSAKNKALLKAKSLSDASAFPDDEFIRKFYTELR